MLHDLLLTSAIAAALGTVLLLLGGRLPLGSPVWRVLIGLIVGAVAFMLGGRSEASIAVVVADLVLALLVPLAWWAIGSIAFANLTVATVLYIAYLVNITFVLTNSVPSLILGTILLLLQVGALGLMVASVFEMIDALCRPVTLPPLPSPPAGWPVVCFQVPAHEEPPDILIKTIRSLAAIDYPRERLVVQVVDNNTTDESLWRPVEAECARLAGEGYRVEFNHLENLAGYKAGALNWARRHLPDDVEFLVIVDSDYIVGPGFLRNTIPYFNDPKVAFVQSPQEYREWEGSAFYRACHTGFAYFFVVGMISRSYRNSIIFAGTMGLIRRSALEAVGGWDEAIITEDAETSLRMLARGGRGIYVPQAFGRGIMPLTYEAMRGQRFRWAFGGIQILRKHWRSLLPWSRSGLNQRQRRDYLLGGLWWFNDAMTLGFTFYVAATAIGFLAHRPFVVQRLYGLGIVLPLLYLALGLIRYLWGLRAATGVSLREALDAMRVNLSLSWVVTLACVRGLIEKRGIPPHPEVPGRVPGIQAASGRVGRDSVRRCLDRSSDLGIPRRGVLGPYPVARQPSLVGRDRLRIRDDLCARRSGATTGVAPPKGTPRARADRRNGDPERRPNWHPHRLGCRDHPHCRRSRGRERADAYPGGTGRSASAIGARELASRVERAGRSESQRLGRQEHLSEHAHTSLGDRSAGDSRPDAGGDTASHAAGRVERPRRELDRRLD